MRRYQVEVTTEGAEEDQFLQVLADMLAGKRVHMLHVEPVQEPPGAVAGVQRIGRVDDLPEPFRSFILGRRNHP